MKVVWRPEARAEMDAIRTYLAAHNPAAALALAEALILAGDSLATFPNRGRPGRVPGTRELIAVPPYLLIYEVDAMADRVRILSIWHSARDR